MYSRVEYRGDHVIISDASGEEYYLGVKWNEHATNLIISFVEDCLDCLREYGGIDFPTDYWENRAGGRIVILNDVVIMERKGQMIMYCSKERCVYSTMKETSLIVEGIVLTIRKDMFQKYPEYW